MFRLDRLTKWRIRSISPISGNGGGAAAIALVGKRLSRAGTSHAGSRWQRRPGWLISNRRSVDWLLVIGFFASALIPYASYVSASTFLQVAQRLFRQTIQTPRGNVLLKLSIPGIRIKRGKP